MSLAPRRNSASLLTWTTVAFIVTVMGTRVYLQLTGFPSIGGGTLHIAHAVWGGLLLIVAAVLPQLFAPTRVLTVAAAVAGIGAGLFVDEIGKFVTRDNDYFFAPAAPLIYGSGLLLVLLAVRAADRRPGGTGPAWYAALDLLGPAGEGQLTHDQAVTARELLDQVASDGDRPELADLARTMSRSVGAWSHLPPHRAGRVARVGRALDTADRRWVPRWIYGVLAVLSSLTLLAYALLAGMVAFLLAIDVGVRGALAEVLDGGDAIEGPIGEAMLWVCVGGALGCVVLLAAAAVQRLRGRRESSATWAIRAAVLVLVSVNLAASFIDISVLALLMVFQLIGLGLLVRYRSRARTG